MGGKCQLSSSGNSLAPAYEASWLPKIGFVRPIVADIAMLAADALLLLLLLLSVPSLVFICLLPCLFYCLLSLNARVGAKHQL